MSDLDGTLLQDDATLSDTTRQLLNRLLADGAPITVASARSVVSIRALLAGVALSLPVIEFNGAFLSDLSSGTHEWINDLPGPLAADIFGAVAAAGLQPFLSTFDGRRDRLYAPPPANAGMAWYVRDRQDRGDARLVGPGPVEVGLRERVVCFTVVDRPEPLAGLRRLLAEACGDRVQLHLWENNYDPGWHWLTVHDRRATKDQAVAALARRLGGEREVVAFGDQQNDTGMLRAAHRGVAVANAVDEVKAVADVVIGGNGEDSVARYMARDWQARTAGTVPTASAAVE